MDFLNADAFNLRSALMFFVALGAAYFIYKATKHFLVGLLCLVAALGGAGYLSGVITPDRVRQAASAVKDKASGSLESANDKAKKIGEQGYSTSAGGASEVNEAYKQNLDVKKKNRAPR